MWRERIRESKYYTVMGMEEGGPFTVVRAWWRGMTCHSKLELP